MNIAICDDEEFYRAQVLKIVQEYSTQNPDKDISITAFAHGDDIMDASAKIGGFDIYILDIVMPEINGIELGIKLREAGYNGQIIYLTSSEDFAIASYKVKAYNYILKPFKKNEFFSALNDVIEYTSTETETGIIIKTKDSSVKVSLDNIMYAELYKRTITYHLTNGTTIDSIQIRTAFSVAIEDLLNDERFVMCGSSKVLNLQHITKIENESITFKDTYNLYLSKKACREIRSAWSEY